MIILNILNPEGGLKEEKKKNAENITEKKNINCSHDKILRVQVININGEIVDIER